jgi:basic membrane protein A
MSKGILRGMAIAVALALLAGSVIEPAHAGDPTKLRIAGVLSAGKESPWEKSLIDSFNRVIKAKPHGLDISVDYTENVYDNAEQVFRTYAETGNYDIVFGDTAYADAIQKVMGDYPDTMFVMSGSGNRGLGANAYWIFVHLHEPTYVMGELAGRLTKTNTLGVVSTFPAEDTNDQINAFVAGAKAVNPAAKVKISFIQSWFDPQKSNEATNAQVAVGADQIFEMSGAFEVCQQKHVTCYGNYIDMAPMASDAILASAVALGSADRLADRPVVECQDERRQAQRPDGGEVVWMEGRGGRSRLQPAACRRNYGGSEGRGRHIGSRGQIGRDAGAP